MERDYSELRKRIRGTYNILGDFAADLGITAGTLSYKLSGKSEWSRAEIAKVVELLDLTPEETLRYFF